MEITASPGPCISRLEKVNFSQQNIPISFKFMHFYHINCKNVRATFSCMHSVTSMLLSKESHVVNQWFNIKFFFLMKTDKRNSEKLVFGVIFCPNYKFYFKCNILS